MDDARDERGASGWHQLRQDVRFGLRSLGRRPAFTFLIIITLGLGVGATSALFAVVRAVLLAPLPYGQSDGVAVVWSAWTGFDQTWLSYDEYEAWRSGIPAFKDVAIYDNGAAVLTANDQPERVRTSSVAAQTFDILAARPILGRTFTEEECRPNGPVALILAYELWQRRYGGDPAVVGRTVQVNGTAIPVVGVAPPGFRMPQDYGASGPTQLYMPLQVDAQTEGAVPGPEFNRNGGSHGFYAVARLTPGATVDLANEQLHAYVARLEGEGAVHPEKHFRAYAVPVQQQIAGSVRTAVLIVFGAVGFLLAIACANVAGLLLVRGEQRRRELAVRVALGAGPARLTRLLLSESALLAACGGLVGVAVAWVSIRVLHLVAPASLPRFGDVRVDPSMVICTIVVSCGAALLFGTLPALQARRVMPSDELKEGGRGSTTSGARLRWREALVTAEVALAVVLVVGAGLMVRTVVNLYAIDPGFDPSHVLTMRISTPSTTYPDSVRVAGFWSEAQRRVAALPGVQSTGAVLLLPLATEMGDWGLKVEGYTPPPHQGTPGDWQVVTPGYFETMGLKLVQGRALGTGDGFGAPLAMVVNRRFVELYLTGRQALGTRVRIGGSPDSLRYTIVGVVDNVHHNALTREVKAQFYTTLAQFAEAPGNTMRSMSLLVRTTGDPRPLIAPARSVIRTIDAGLPVSEIRTMEEVVGASIAGQRFAMQLLGVFGALAMLLSAIGVYGVVSQVMEARHQEFGIRAALGATPAQLLGLGLTSGLRQTLIGLAAGIVLAVVATRLMVRLLQGVSPTDPVTFLVVVIVTGGVAVAASLIPARRAVRVSPGIVLRSG